jgi:hypothetical protein
MYLFESRWYCWISVSIWLSKESRSNALRSLFATIFSTIPSANPQKDKNPYHHPYTRLRCNTFFHRISLSISRVQPSRCCICRSKHTSHPEWCVWLRLEQLISFCLRRCSFLPLSFGHILNISSAMMLGERFRWQSTHNGLSTSFPFLCLIVLFIPNFPANIRYIEDNSPNRASRPFPSFYVDTPFSFS